MSQSLGLKPKKDTSLSDDIAKRERATQKREEQLKREADASRKARRGRSAGRRGLLSGLETGVVGGEVDKIG